MPAACSNRTAACATSGVAGAGLATTELPAASAAVIWPMKIASGKFQGLMHTNTPRPCSDSVLSSPGRAVQLGGRGEQLAGARRVVAAEVHRLAQLRHRIRQRLAGLAYQETQELAAPRLERSGGALQAGGPLGRRGRIPGGLRRPGRLERPADLRSGRIAGEADDDARVSG